MIIRKAKKGYYNPDEPLKLNDHAKPVTRREFIQQGFMTGAATVTAPTLFSLFANPREARATLSSDINTILNNNCGGRPLASRIPFICFDLAGGANIAGSNVLVGGAGGQKDFLSTAGYDKLGVPGDMKPGINNTDPLNPVSEFFNEDLGLAFHSDSGMYKGIMDSLGAGTSNNINGSVIAARSDNDTGNNPHNPMYGIAKTGQDGRLLTLIGSRNSNSGGNSMAPMSLYDANIRPTKVDRPSDVQGLVDTGELGNLFATPQDTVYVMEAIQRLSDKKLNNVNTNITADAVIKEMIRCGYVKSADLVDEFGNPASLNPDADTDIVGASGIFSTAEYNSDNEYRKTASVMKLVCNGYAGAGTITMGGYDYHTGDRVTGEIRDYRAGRCIGACLEYAARVGTPLMLYVFSDGSVSSNGRIDNSVSTQTLKDGSTPIYDGGASGKGEWTSDNSGTASSMILVYNPGGRPVLIDDGSIPVERRQQIGYFTSEANVVTSSSPAANNVVSLVDMVLLNYMALNNELGNFTSTFPGHGLGSNYADYVSFEGIFTPTP
ncbi:MAG: general secretion pathway protein GspF [Gammaproteobacteria bacterium]